MLSYLKQTIGSIPVAHIGQYKTVADAAKLIRDKDTTSILVTKKDSSEPVGIVTERDILYRVLAQNKDPFAIPAQNKIREIEEGVAPSYTRVVNVPDDIIKEIIRINESSNELSICATAGGIQFTFKSI